MHFIATLLAPTHHAGLRHLHQRQAAEQLEEAMRPDLQVQLDLHMEETEAAPEANTEETEAVAEATTAQVPLLRLRNKISHVWVLHAILSFAALHSAQGVHGSTPKSPVWH